jgi:anti-anti-sigma regulatory factor
MPTEITQIEDNESGNTILRVSGELLFDDAGVLEQIATGIRTDTGKKVVIDLADLDFLDSEAAPVLRRLADTEGFSIEGVEIFLQSSIDQAERQGVESHLT